ncbi:hypothetical protein ACFPK5_25260 [Streptomyces beijiangensis]|uniref:hypothetical protein n=1 Tax=Streptomyces beijiangensis TaxID=163361 RepID=UPI0031CFB93C
MARHAVSKTSTAARRAALRAGLTLTAASAAIGMGATVAQAAPVVAPQPTGQATLVDGPTAIATGALTGSLQHALAPAGQLRLDPLAGTGVDPLDNAVGTQLADFKPISTAAATGPLTQGASLSDLLGS